MTARPRQIIVTDANVLINLMHVSRLDIHGGQPLCLLLLSALMREPPHENNAR